MEENKLYYSDLKARKIILNYIIKKSEVWKRFTIFRIGAYSASLILFVAVILWVVNISETFEEFLSVFEVYGFVAVALAVVPWAFQRSRLPKAYAKAGYPFACMANEMISIDKEIFCYSYGETGSWRIVSSKRKGNFADIDVTEFSIDKSNIQNVVVENGVCTVIGKWNRKEKFVEKIDFEAMVPTVKKRVEAVEEFSFLLDFNDDDVKEILEYLNH